MEDDKVFYQASDHFVTRTIAGETILVPVGEQTKKLNGFVTFTETGQFLWNLLLQKRCTKTDLIIGLSQEYNCSIAEIQEDVSSFLEKGLDKGMIIQYD